MLKTNSKCVFFSNGWTITILRPWDAIAFIPCLSTWRNSGEQQENLCLGALPGGTECQIQLWPVPVQVDGSTLPQSKNWGTIQVKGIQRLKQNWNITERYIYAWGITYLILQIHGASKERKNEQLNWNMGSWNDFSWLPADIHWNFGSKLVTFRNRSQVILPILSVKPTHPSHMLFPANSLQWLM